MKISKYLLAVMFSSFVLSACASTPTDDTDVTVEGDATVEVKDDAAKNDDAIKIEVGGDAAVEDDGQLN